MLKVRTKSKAKSLATVALLLMICAVGVVYYSIDSIAQDRYNYERNMQIVEISKTNYIEGVQLESSNVTQPLDLKHQSNLRFFDERAAEFQIRLYHSVSKKELVTVLLVLLMLAAFIGIIFIQNTLADQSGKKEIL